MAKTKDIQTADKLLKSSLFWLSVILFFVVPFINALVLQTVILSVESNIAYKGLAPVLTAVKDVSSVLASYFSLGVIACSVAYYGIKNNKGTVAVALLHFPFEFLMHMISYIISGAKSYAAALFMLGTDASANTLLYAVILAILETVRYKKQKSKTDITPPIPKKSIGKSGMFSYLWASVGVFAAAQLLALIYAMISAFVDPSLGTPINLQEWVYWITEYLTVVIYAVLGYFLALSACYMCEYYKKHFSEDVKKTSKQEAVSERAE